MTNRKPKNPYPLLVRRVLRRVMPNHMYRRFVARHEDISLRIWERLARGVPAKHAILDIGAFHGEFALAARRVNTSARVVAFEPNSKNLDTLRDLCCTQDIETVAAAVAETTGVVRFMCDAVESRIAKASNGPETSGAQLQQVPSVSLDSWACDNDIPLSLIKIDVEGGESSILRGGKRVLNKYQPFMLCEVLSDSAGLEVMAVLPQKYSYFYIDENRGMSEESRITRKCWRNKNWLFVPELHVGTVYELLEGLILKNGKKS